MTHRFKPDPGLHILVVDDSAEIRLLVSHFLTRMGHIASVASNGIEALRRIETNRPDLIFLDVMMPGMDGFETAERVKAMHIDGWLPLIFLTANTEDAAIARGVEVGGDDYLIKPISFIMLKAKLDAFSRMLTMQRQIAQKNAELEVYYDRTEDEQRIASALMNRMVRVDMLRDPLLKYWIAPAHHISGDLVAAARTPRGALHVLLADGTGHGLAASINVMPVAEPFYDMTAQGYGIGAIITELNARVKKWLPTERFVAATLLAFDPHEHLIEVWVGGNPCPVFAGFDGRVLHQFSMRHLPLGIAGREQFDAHTEVFPLDCEGELVLFSDGALEVANAAGEQLNRSAIVSALRTAPRARALEQLQSLVLSHLDGSSPHDDISIATINCKFASRTAERFELPQGAAGVEAGWRAQLRFTAQELREIDAVPLLLELVRQLNLRQTYGALFVVVAELFNNALDHGVLRLDSRLKSEPDGMERYLALRQQRLAALRSAYIDISLEIVDDDGAPAMAVSIVDCGAGFNHARVVEERHDERAPYGRGIGLVRRLCSQLTYRGCGNDVTAIYRLAPAMPGVEDAEASHA